jgi:hypothetical protein
MGEDTRPYQNPDKSYIAFIEYPYARRRTEIGVTRGNVEWFIVRLEYNVNTRFDQPDDWRQVAGFDHHPGVDWGHDITVERLHLDVYRDERKAHVKRGFPEVEVNRAPGYCERFLDKHADYYLDQFEDWHDL